MIKGWRKGRFRVVLADGLHFGLGFSVSFGKEFVDTEGAMARNISLRVWAGPWVALVQRLPKGP